MSYWSSIHTNSSGVKKLSRGLAASLAGVALMTLAACGGTSTSSSTSSGYTVGTDEPDYLTPGRTVAIPVALTQLFAPLVKFRGGKMFYEQAKSITSDDNKLWTVKIKPGWTFHNGEPVTARSYVDAMNTTAYGPNAWQASYELAKIAGYDDLNPSEGKPTTKVMSGLKVIDDTTFTVTLAEPDSQFPAQMSEGATAFLPTPKVAYDDPKSYEEAPVGDGPYKMKGVWEHNKSMELEKFDGYKGTEAKAKSISFKFYNDQATAYTDLQAGNLDLIVVPDNKFVQAKEVFGDRVRGFNVPVFDFLGFPKDDPRFADIRVRKAISMAIDRDAISKSVFGGFYTPAAGLTTAAYQGGGTARCDYCKFDPAKAKQLLADAGGWKGDMTIWFPGGKGSDPEFTAIANQIRQNLGIANVKAQPKPNIGAFYQALEAGTLDGPFRGHLGSTYPAMADLLSSEFTSIGFGAIDTHYSSAKVDALLASARVADSSNGAIEDNRAAEQQILDDAPVVPLFSPRYVFAWSKRITNVKMNVIFPAYDQIEVVK